MIDIHTHILPNIDDGSTGIDETISLLKEAKEAGFTGVTFTPHYKEGQFETNVNEREILVKAINKNLKLKGVEIDTYLGNEIYITDNMIKLFEDGKASTLNDSSYVLFELPLNIEPENLYNVVHSLTKYKLVPILAHPERYLFVQKDPELIYDLIQRGVLMQANYGSIIGQYGKKAQFLVTKMFENNLVHFLGTDVHREKTIYKKLPFAIQAIQEIVGIEKFEEYSYENPKLALNNKRIDIREPINMQFSVKEKIIMMLPIIK